MDFLNIPNIDVYFVIGILITFGAFESILGHYAKSDRSKDDWILESIGFFVLAVAKILVFAGMFFFANKFLPSLKDVLSGWHLLAGALFYVLIDDHFQYWYHRSAHEYNFLWKHHRTHHAASNMGILTAYRNSFVYYLFLPNLYWASLCTFLGLGPGVVLGLIFKQIIVTSTHSSWHWDEVLYKHKALSPLTWLVEHILITPAFHHAHHGKSQADHISDPNGNFGNAFSLWDQIYGTAKFTRKFPETYGLQTDPEDGWAAHVFYPAVKSKKEGSEMAPGHKKEKHTLREPLKTKLATGTYLYCQCGYSSEQPWCNGSHHGTKIKPLIVDIANERNVSICTCKLTKSPPYCDDSHKTIK